MASVLSHAGNGNGNGDNPASAITLDTAISQTGSLSAGERQLVALARAVLRRSNVVIMDEATSQIDTQLDDRVSPHPQSHRMYCSHLILCADSADYPGGVHQRHCHHDRP